ncbi:hypothetical protein [Synechococcus sp. PCC 7335]|uniref:hypothetical protein n=1 Tax=Synechococcus sp. (strain ATCC 29403 / PCC 7335) TaxID=91464 RepID=UPI0002E1B4B0|nr:hypothetical protein [Synechococcus sp. PCC 7335]
MTHSTASSIHSSITEAVLYVEGEGSAPDAGKVIDALLQAEKERKRTKRHYDYAQLIGRWRLGFVSGTRKVPPRPGSSAITTLGKGRFVPRLIRIAIAYEPLSKGDHANEGKVTNSVTCGPIQLRLKGPTRFWQKTSSLGFDFTAIQVKLGAWSIYEGELRGGSKRNAAFKEQSLGDQAFFTFFLVTQDYIAARGRGGGLALWVREDSEATYNRRVD